jgi:hypothetical protein
MARFRKVSVSVFIEHWNVVRRCFVVGAVSCASAVGLSVTAAVILKHAESLAADGPSA